jgi:ribosomal protein L27
MPIIISGSGGTTTISGSGTTVSGSEGTTTYGSGSVSGTIGSTTFRETTVFSGSIYQSGSGNTVYFLDNVGIGTEVPLYKLSVTGTLGVSEASTFAKGITVAKTTTTAVTDDSGNNAPFAPGSAMNVRAGSITVTITAGDAIPATTGYSLGTITCDQVKATDVIIANIVNVTSDGSTPSMASLAPLVVAIIPDTSFKILVLNMSATAVPQTGTFVLNWAIV